MDHDNVLLNWFWVGFSAQDLLKVIFFARSEFAFKNFAQSYALKLFKKYIRFEKNLSLQIYMYVFSTNQNHYFFKIICGT